jgi:hypothetical protein
MNRKIVLGTSAALALVGSLAIAGLKAPGTAVRIVVSGAQSSFSGTLATVRNSANSTEYIGCQLTQYYFVGPPFTNHVYCTAKDTSGQTAGCSASGPSNWQPLGGITPNSQIDVRFNADTGECTSINVTNNSTLPIIQP